MPRKLGYPLLLPITYVFRWQISFPFKYFLAKQKYLVKHCTKQLLLRTKSITILGSWH